MVMQLRDFEPCGITLTRKCGDKIVAVVMQLRDFEPYVFSLFIGSLVII
jgi:hypothetical protein